MTGSRHDQWKLLDNFRRKTYIKYELKKRILKSLKVNRSLPLSYRYYVSFQMSLLPRSSSLVKQRNRCILLGRK